MTTPDLPPLPRVTRSMVFKHFGPNAGRDLLRTEWKDGIDLEVATYALQCFAEDYAAAAVLAEREKSEAVRAALVELVACKDLKDSAGFGDGVANIRRGQARRDDYERRKPLAWAAARAAIRAELKEQQPLTTIEDVMAQADGCATPTPLRAAIEQYAAERVAEARKPLTDEQIIDATESIDTSRDGYFIHIARAIERAHGIGEQQNG